MSLRYFRQLSGAERSQRADRHLGYSLACVAGAVNAGGFLAIGQYTSHMTGIVSSMADHLVLGELAAALSAATAVFAFLFGAATTSILINFAKRRRLKSRFALSLLLEAGFLLLFGVFGTYLSEMHEFLVPGTVLLLCYIMGLQNAIITKVSNAVIRTTHVTGLLTDFGIEFGKLIYFNYRNVPHLAVRANREKLVLHFLLVFHFFFGGVSGAVGFKYIGYSSTIVLSAGLMLLAIGPVWSDVSVRWQVLKRRARQKRNSGNHPG